MSSRAAAFRALLSLGLMSAWSIPAVAQMACPQGVTPGSSQCLPSGGTSEAPTPRPRWRTAWGAMVEDRSTGYVGTSSGYFSRAAAIREAKRKCVAMGGGNCKPVFDYKNNCAVMAETEPDSRGRTTAYYQDGRDVDEASKLAQAACMRAGGEPCKVVYSGCSYPVLVN